MEPQMVHVEEQKEEEKEDEYIEELLNAVEEDILNNDDEINPLR